MIYYISDLHIGDIKILKLCNRPFENNKDFLDFIVEKWNTKVSKKDVVFILGDLIDTKDINNLFSYEKLNGEKHLIIGNHDLNILKDIKESKIFASISTIKTIKDIGRKVNLCHYPMFDWMDMDKGSYLVYGHIHNKTEKNDVKYKLIKDYYKNYKAYNCSADVIGFVPVTLDELIKLKEDNVNEPYIN